MNGARESGLAGAEVARQRDQVARLDQPGNVGHARRRVACSSSSATEKL